MKNVTTNIYVELVSDVNVPYFPT